MIRQLGALAALCLIASPVVASEEASDATLEIMNVEVADYSAVDSTAVSGASFGNWLGNFFGNWGNRGSGSGSSSGSSGGATDVPAPPVALIFGAAVVALGARSRMKKRNRI